MPLLRLTWHPLTVAAVIAVSACLAAVLGPMPSLWLVMGAAAGFATSGST
jgi:hypothetical protein